MGRYLVDEHVVEVVGEAPGESVPQLTEQHLLLLHRSQLVVPYGKPFLTNIDNT